MSKRYSFSGSGVNMNMEHWWSDNRDERTEVHRESRSHCHFVHHKPYLESPGIKSEHPQ